jgi:hypothetical protein
MSQQIAGWKVDTEEREELLRRFPPALCGDGRRSCHPAFRY